MKHLFIPAHDRNTTTCGAYQSTVILAPGPNIYMTVGHATDLNPGTCGSICWAVAPSLYPSIYGSTAVWDEAKIDIGGGCPLSVGNGASPCSVGSPFYFGTSCCSTNPQAAWTTYMGDTYLALQ